MNSKTVLPYDRLVLPGSSGYNEINHLIRTGSHIPEAACTALRYQEEIEEWNA